MESSLEDIKKKLIECLKKIRNQTLNQDRSLVNISQIAIWGEEEYSQDITFYERIMEEIKFTISLKDQNVARNSNYISEDVKEYINNQIDLINSMQKFYLGMI